MSSENTNDEIDNLEKEVEHLETDIELMLVFLFDIDHNLQCFTRVFVVLENNGIYRNPQINFYAYWTFYSCCALCQCHKLSLYSIIFYRSSEINQLQSKSSIVEQEGINRQEQRWTSIRSIVHAKCALKQLFDMV